MQHGVLVIQTEAKVGREADFGRFYDEVHIPEIVQTPGFTVGRRYHTVTDAALPARPDQEWHTNLAIYDVVSPHLVSAYAGLLQRMTDGTLTSTDVFSTERPYRAQLFEQVFEGRPT